MRLVPYALAACVAFAVPVAARAETVMTYTPAGGASITFTLSTILEFNPGFAVDYGIKENDDVDVAFFDPAADPTGPFALLDFQYEDDRFGFADYDGVKLYSGPESSPTFIPGTYDLGVSTLPGNTATTATLVIANVASTPEPSSFFLLGTGILGFVGAVRRRFSKS